jgi:RNA binding exosome subunit
VTVRRIEIQTFVHATEDREKVLRSLETLLPFPFQPEATVLLGHFRNPIELLRVEARRRKEVEGVLRRLVEGLSPPERERIVGEMEDRLVDGKFYLRLEKMGLPEGRLSLGEGVQVTIHLTSHPYREEAIRGELEGIFLPRGERKG